MGIHMGRMMSNLRYVLIVLSAAGAIFMTYVLVDEPRSWFVTIPAAAGFLLNLWFLWSTHVTKSDLPGRMTRMLRLSLDAK